MTDRHGRPDTEGRDLNATVAVRREAPERRAPASELVPDASGGDPIPYEPRDEERS